MTPKAIALHSAAGGAAGAGRPTLTRAALELYAAKPAGGGGKPGSPLGQHPVPVQPQGSDHPEVREVGAEARPRGEDRGAAGIQRRRALQAHPGDVLRRHGLHDGSVVDRVEKLFTCCVPTDESLGKKKASPRWSSSLGEDHQLPGVHHPGQAKYTLFTADGTPIRATCSVSLEEMPGDPLGQNPTSGALAARALHTVVVGDSLASIAYGEYGDPTLWRPLAAFNGIDDPMRLSRGRSLFVPAVDELLAGSTREAETACQPQISNAFVVAIDGTPLPDDVEHLLVAATSTTASTCRTCSILRFRDSDRMVLSQVRREDRFQADGLRDQQRIVQPGAADHGGGDRAGGGVRQHRDVHRDPRLRPGAPAVPRPAHRDLHPDHRVGRREEGRPACRADRRHDRIDQHGLRSRSQGGLTDWEFLDGLAREIGYEIAVKDGKFDFRKPQHGAGGPGRRCPPARNPLVLRLGTDLLRFRSVVTSAEQVKEVQVRGWDLAQKKALVGTAPAKTSSAQLARTA